MTVIKHLFHINTLKDNVFKALSTIEGLAGWWTVQTSGECKIGGTIEFRFGEMGFCSMKVLESKPSEWIKWECVAGPPDWIGTTIGFYLDENDNKTRVRFEHSGWKEANDFYGACSFAWGRYMESLRQLCQTGQGEAFGSEGYRQ